MTVIGFSFTKLTAELKKPSKGNLKVNSHVKINGLDKTNLSFDNKKTALKADFTYAVEYEPAVGNIEFKGDILFLQEQDEAQKLLDQFAKKKNVPKKIATVLVNNILKKSTMQAIIMSRDIALPPPIPLPGVKTKAGSGTKPAAKK